MSLKELTEKEKEELAVLKQEMQKKLDLQMKQLIADGYRTHTTAFTLAKMTSIKNNARKWHVEVGFMDNIFEMRWSSILAVSLYKLGFGGKTAYWLSRLRRLRFILHPIEIYVMDTHKLYFNLLDLKSKYIFEDYKAKTIWEPETTRLVRKEIKPGDVCIDIGASIGYFTLLFSQCTGKIGKVYAFEPMERGYKYLCKNIRINGYADRAKAFQLGAWDKSEIVGMPRCDDKPIPVQCVSISEHLEKLGVTKVDFIKIDIDGSEPWAFKGLIPLFEKNPQMKMVCEYYPKYIKNAGGDPQDMMDIVDKYFTKEIISGDYGGDCVNFFCIRKNEEHEVLR